jgi:hypothetical protein
LSGLLTADEKDIVEACNNQKLKFLKRRERNNWISMFFIKSL